VTSIADWRTFANVRCASDPHECIQRLRCLRHQKGRLPTDYYYSLSGKTRLRRLHTDACQSM